MPYDPQEHHRRSIRLARYDYSEAGSYFVTICTERSVCLFGEVREDRVELSESGMIVERSWKQMPQRFPNTALDLLVVMPNHVDGIILISSPAPVSVGAIHESPFQRPRHATPRTLRTHRRQMVLPKMIGCFKMNTAKQINHLHGTPGSPVWQRNYYEHVIREESDLSRIREYIQSNPLKWLEDENHPLRIATGAGNPYRGNS